MPPDFGKTKFENDREVLSSLQVVEEGDTTPSSFVQYFDPGTEYTINAIPLGGFVNLMGENDPNVPGGFATAKPSVRAPILLAGGGTFLVFLFFHWLFLDPKHFGLRGEQFFMRQGVWFYAVVSILLTLIVWFALQRNPTMPFGAVVGSTAFFITHGFKDNAAQSEKELMKEGLSDVSKIFYLEVIDASSTR